MNFSVQQSVLFPVLQSVSRSCGMRSQLPVLANVLISARSGELKISATNLEVGVVKSLPAEVGEEGEVTVPARTLVDIVANLNGQKLDFVASEDQLKISTSGFSSQMNGIAASEFPVIPLAGSNEVLIKAEILTQTLPEVSFSAAVDEGRPVLTGILTEIKDGKLQFVATDGYRLAHRTVPVEEKTSFKALIPRKTLEEVARLIAEDSAEEIKVSTSENQNQMIFEFGNTSLSSRLIDGQFPAWEKIIPAEYKATLTVDRQALLKAVKLSAVFAKNEANVIKFQVVDQKLVLASEAKELGSQTNEINAEVSGEEMTIAFNAKFVQDALSAAPTAQVMFELSGPLSAAAVKPIGEEGLQYIIMPVNLS